jgi:hypothetical protein
MLISEVRARGSPPPPDFGMKETFSTNMFSISNPALPKTPHNPQNFAKLLLHSIEQVGA